MGPDRKMSPVVMSAVGRGFALSLDVLLEHVVRVPITLLVVVVVLLLIKFVRMAHISGIG